MNVIYEGTNQYTFIYDKTSATVQIMAQNPNACLK